MYLPITISKTNLPFASPSCGFAPLPGLGTLAAQAPPGGNPHSPCRSEMDCRTAGQLRGDCGQLSSKPASLSAPSRRVVPRPFVDRATGSAGQLYRPSFHHPNPHPIDLGSRPVVGPQSLSRNRDEPQRRPLARIVILLFPDLFGPPASASPWPAWPLPPGSPARKGRRSRRFRVDLQLLPGVLLDGRPPCPRAVEYNTKGMHHAGEGGNPRRCRSVITLPNIVGRKRAAACCCCAGNPSLFASACANVAYIALLRQSAERFNGWAGGAPRRAPRDAYSADLI
ncbi:hypothetical protein GGR56DRAFT_431876 [Xylariaceae sp. FL0804]|nr:hypothetical protein GGR56DRAFT_431876 [Xylariaceae sp. FL0804]